MGNKSTDSGKEDHLAALALPIHTIILQVQVIRREETELARRDRKGSLAVTRSLFIYCSWHF